jgi:hypothetical protein
MTTCRPSRQWDNIDPPMGQYSPTRGTMLPSTVPPVGLFVTKLPPLQSRRWDTSNIPVGERSGCSTREPSQ